MMAEASRVLYVDDEPGLLDIGKLFLEESGDFTVTTAISATEGIRLLEQEKFDAIISDYQMPGMDGIQFLVEVRKRFGQIPFILFTGRGREEVVIQAINNGADFYLQKGGEPGAQFAELSHKIKAAVERKKSDMALKESERSTRLHEERLIMAQEIGRTGSWEFNLETNEIWGSAEGLRIFGFPPVAGAFPIDDIEACIPERERVHQALVDLIGEGMEYNLEYAINPADGSDPKIIHSFARLEKDNRGNPLKVMGVMQDITGRKKSENEILFKNVILSTQQETSPDAILIVDENGKILSYNQKFIGIFGIPDELIASRLDEPVLQFVVGQLADPEAFLSRVRYLYEHKSEKSFEELLLRDGRTLERFSSPMLGETGAYYGRVWYFRDITGRKQVETELVKKNEELNASYEQITAAEEELRGNLDELARQEQALRKSEASLRAILDATPFPVALVDLEDNNINYWSRSATTLFGHTAPTAAQWYQLAYPDPDYRQDVIDRWKPYLEQAKRSGQPVNTGEYRVTCRDGTVRTCELYATFLEDKLVVTFNDVTERKVALAALTENEERLRTTLEILPVGVFIFSRTGQILAANAMVNRIWGVTEGVVPHSSDMEEFVEYKGWWPETGVALGPGDWAASRVLMKGETAPVDTVNIQRFDGRHGTIIVSAVPIHDAGGNINGAVAVIQDITERKVAEEALLKNAEELQSAYEELTASEEELRQNVDDLGRSERVLRESEDCFRGIFDTITSGVAIYEVRNDGASGKDYIIRDFNKTALEIEGKKKEDVVGKSLSDLRPAIDEYGLIPVFQEVWETGVPAYFPQKVYIDEKYSSWYENRVFRLHSGEIVAVYEDVTERKQAEEALRTSEQKLNSILNNITDVVWSLSWPDMKVHYISPSAEQVYGRSVQEFIDKPSLWTEVVYPDDRHISDKVLGELQKYGSAVRECRIVRPDGSIAWILDRSKFIYDEHGNPVRAEGITSDITGGKVAEEALQESEEFNRNLVENLPDYIIVYRPDGKILYVNPATVKGFGYNLNELVGTSVISYIAPECRTRVTATIATRLKGDDTPEYETVLITKEGQRKTVIAKGTLIHYHDGLATLLLLTDITERKVAENTLIETTEYLQNLFDYANAPIIVWDPDYVITRFNHAFEDLTLRSEQEVLGQNLDILFPKESRDASLLQIKKTLEGEHWKTVEIPILIKDGSVRTVLWNSANVLDSHGRIISTIAQGVDITDRKVAEDALKEREEDLVEAQKIAKLGKWELDLVNNTLHWSDGIYEMFEINPALFGATYEAFLNWIHPDDRDRVNSAYAGSLKNRQPYEISHRLRMKDGRIKWVNEICHTEYNAQGQPLRSVGIVQDISGIKQAEEALTLANKKLNLLSSITRHDINNQMTVLQGYLAILKKKQPDSSFAEYFLKINAAAGRISAMILFTREYENIGLNAPVWQDCDTLVDTAAKQATPGLVIVKNDLPAGAEVFADPLIAKVFYNLMDNAVRYGGKITTIRFSVEEAGDEHRIVCEDDGDGIQPDEKEKIFEKGYGKNTGMGLFLSREILAITGIAIRETGEPGEGARFEMTVPKGAWRTTGTTDSHQIIQGSQ